MMIRSVKRGAQSCAHRRTSAELDRFLKNERRDKRQPQRRERRIGERNRQERHYSNRDRTYATELRSKHQREQPNAPYTYVIRTSRGQLGSAATICCTSEAREEPGPSDRT